MVAVDVNGARLAYDEVGAGDAVALLLHSGLTDRRMWAPQLPALAAAGYRAVAPDLRGFGESTLPAGMFAEHADVLGLLDVLGLDSVHLIGSSYGGRIALDVALSAPERVRSLVLLGAVPSGHGWSDSVRAVWGEVERAVEAGDLDTANEAELRLWVDGAGRSADQVDPTVRALVRDANRIVIAAEHDPDAPAATPVPLDPPAVHRLDRLAVPTLVVIGALDVPDVHQAAARLAALGPRVRLLQVPATAHFPSLERPDLVNAAIVEFLAGAG